MKIGLLVDPIKNKPTGVSNYTREISSKLINLDKVNQYVFIDYKVNEFNKNNLLLIHNPFIFLKTYLWHNLLPIKLKNKKLDYLINFHGAPHFLPYRQKEVFVVYDLSWLHFSYYHRFGRSLLIKMFFKRTLKKSYAIVAISQDVKEDLITTYAIDENKIFVIYPSLPMVSIQSKKPTIKLDFTYILFVGTLEPRKNIETLLKAYKILKQKDNTKLKLIICGGKGWKYNRIFKLTQDLNLKKDVIFTGYATESEKKYLYEHAEVFIFPSWYEGFGIPLLEAMINGCPIITSNVSSLPEVVGNAGICINPNSAEEIAKAIRKVTSNSVIRNNLIKKGYEQIKKINSNSFINQFIKNLLNHES